MTLKETYQAFRPLLTFSLTPPQWKELACIIDDTLKQRLGVDGNTLRSASNNWFSIWFATQLSISPAVSKEDIIQAMEDGKCPLTVESPSERWELIKFLDSLKINVTADTAVAYCFMKIVLTDTGCDQRTLWGVEPFLGKYFTDRSRSFNTDFEPLTSDDLEVIFRSISADLVR